MKETPKGWPRISSCIYYDDPRAAIDWICKTFGFETKLLVEGEGGRVEHSELVFSDGLIMVGDAGKREFQASPAAIEGRNTQALLVIVDDVDKHCERARAAGATIEVEPETHDYGDDYWTDRTYQAIDLEGHRWWFSQRLRG